ncbi:radical SAM protein [Thalassotalea sp. G20_0]|uniref:B12-binding domain-containing radical SAM protein n=1 Tax=Thalassotalea sp. G20_0 TaxID=2821093 RepID=UPI001ADB964F|nr:radical SAM protein [Thalassotalea sp. G20_0]MBO9497035.1 radical SAM protein [Thalassotalea sp. G20_0]
MERIFCISAGQTITKKADNIINRRNRYLNYGLLSLATELEENGFHPVQLQGNFDSPDFMVQKCLNFGLEHTSHPILISIPSFYALPWVNGFINLLKAIKPSSKVIVGGRWVIGDEPELLKELIPGADLLVPGTANHKIVEIVKSFSVPSDFVPKTSNAKYPRLNYQLLDDRHLYQPSIEVSRGCGKGCSFCLERDERLQPLKEAGIVVSEARDIIIRDNLVPMTPYFEASMFAPNKKWIKDLIYEMDSQDMHFNWRTEGRVDSILPGNIPLLCAAGLKVIDLGLESASPVQLVRMNKTSNPEKYLATASELLKICHENEIRVKVNVLLTAGETLKSISETFDWLEKHSKFIAGVSAGPEIVFGLNQSIKNYLSGIANYGASVNHTPIEGVNNINLSHEISWEHSIEISKTISQQFMDAADYYALKSFSYFSRDYTFKDFKDDVVADEDLYSFNISKLYH